MIITESKLDQTIPTNLITIPWQICWRVLMFIADNLVFQQKQTLQSQYYEHIWVDVSLDAFYRPPNESQDEHQLFLDTAEEVLTKLNNYSRANYKIIASD